MSNKHIKLWAWKDAPEHFRALSRNGGDEDWVALIPDELDAPSWLEAMDSCRDPQIFHRAEGTVWIGAHS